MNNPTMYTEFEQAVRDARDFRSATLIVTGWMLSRTHQPNHPGFKQMVLKATADIRGGIK